MRRGGSNYKVNEEGRGDYFQAEHGMSMVVYYITHDRCESGCSVGDAMASDLLHHLIQ